MRKWARLNKSWLSWGLSFLHWLHCEYPSGSVPCSPMPVAWDHFFFHLSVCERISPRAFLTSSLPAEITFTDREAKEGINSSQDETCHCWTILICVFSPGALVLPDGAGSSPPIQPFKCVSAPAGKPLPSERSLASAGSGERAGLKGLGKGTRLIGKKESQHQLRASLSRGDKSIPIPFVSCICGKDGNEAG